MPGGRLANPHLSPRAWVRNGGMDQNLSPQSHREHREIPTIGVAEPTIPGDPPDRILCVDQLSNLLCDLCVSVVKKPV
jgi:hypothetical protein